MKVWTSSFSDIGLVRNKNQDAYTVKVGDYRDDDIALLAVADGMGGMQGGEIASGIAIAYLTDWWNSFVNSINTYTQPLVEASRNLDYVLQNANEQILEYAASVGGQSGTTLSMILLMDCQYLIKHIGDSRIYSVGQYELLQQTKDDSLIQQMLDDGYSDEDIDEMGVGQNILNKCLGFEDYSQMTTMMGTFNSDMELLICSDGVYGYIEEDKLIRSLRKINTKKSNELRIQRKISKLVEKNGAPDNFTYVYARINV